MEPDPGPLPDEQPQFEPPAPETRRAVELALAQLRADPRTQDIVGAVEQALPMLAMTYGVDPQTFPLWDCLQAVADAWNTAQTRAWHEATGAEWDAPATAS